MFGRIEWMRADLQKSVNGKSVPLTFVALRKSMEVARYLLERGASPSGGGLMCVAGNTSFDAVKLLLEFKGDVDERDSEGGTALHLASQYGWLDVVKLLVESGATVDARKDNGKTPRSYGSLVVSGFQRC